MVEAHCIVEPAKTFFFFFIHRLMHAQSMCRPRVTRSESSKRRRKGRKKGKVKKDKKKHKKEKKRKRKEKDSKGRREAGEGGASGAQLPPAVLAAQARLAAIREEADAARAVAQQRAAAEAAATAGGGAGTGPMTAEQHQRDAERVRKVGHAQAPHHLHAHCTKKG